MRTMLLKFTMIAGLFCSLVACGRGSIDSSFLKEDAAGNNNIYRSYSVDYNEQKNQAMATATFSVGSSWGTTVRLQQPASLSVNGSPARENTDVFDGGEISAFYIGFIFPPAWFLMGTTGTTYHKTVAGTSAAFEFVDTSGSHFTDVAQVPALRLSAPQFTSMSGAALQIYGGTSSDTIRVRISQYGISKTVYGTGSSVAISSNDLTSFQPGIVDINVEVESSQAIRADSESLGGDIKTTYSFATRRIQLR
ncbi:MAG: hypothetical protein J7501_15725 [Bdellovibrio sp.]|nr:hypothetical protein [Bdellovibrio sp.]